jgi:hypothetical protein
MDGIAGRERMNDHVATMTDRGGLRWVRVAPGTSLERFPDFMVVGPQRTGTSWLYVNLRFHPQIQLSRPKEIFFFSSLKSRHPKRFVTDDLGWYLRFFRDPAWLWAAKAGVCLARYGRLYRPLVRGESTASYASLDTDVIDDIVRLNPELKVILMVRNPVDRAWSDAKYYFEQRGRTIRDVPFAELREFYTDPYQLSCGQYGRNIGNWSARLKPGHLLAGHFDDIATHPERMLREVMRFLGVSDDRRYVNRSARRPVNTTSASRIEPDSKSFLEQLFADELKWLGERLEFKWT